MTSCATRT